MICRAELNVTHVMITDIALRSHQRTVHQDWSIYLRAARCAENSARANVRIATTIVGGMTEYNAIANSACY